MVRRAQQGDLDAFETLVHLLQSPVLRYLRHLVADPALAEDLAQETFLRVHAKLDRFRFQSRFSTWVVQIAHNAGVDALRQRERRRRLHDALAATPPPPTVVDAAARVEVTAAVASLPAVLRDAFLLVEQVGLTYREAGGALGVPEGTVKSRVHRARRQLVSWLTADRPARGGVPDAL